MPGLGHRRVISGPVFAAVVTVVWALLSEGAALVVPAAVGYARGAYPTGVLLAVCTGAGIVPPVSAMVLYVRSAGRRTGPNAAALAVALAIGTSASVVAIRLRPAFIDRDIESAVVLCLVAVGAIRFVPRLRHWDRRATHASLAAVPVVVLLGALGDPFFVASFWTAAPFGALLWAAIWLTRIGAIGALDAWLGIGTSVKAASAYRRNRRRRAEAAEQP